MIATIRKIIKKTVSALGYSIVRQAPPQPRGELVVNVFQASHSKAVLLSYIKSVFVNPENRKDLRHTNRYTTYAIAEIFDQLGYRVDVVDCGEDYNGDFSGYDLVFGLGKALDHVLLHRGSQAKTKVIYFGTGCNPLFSNIVTLRRLTDSCRLTGQVMLDSTRYIKEDWPLQHELADWSILHGSRFARATYETGKMSCIYAPVFIYHNISRTDSEWQAAKKHYLWFGVGGLVHKGLDLAIEAFKQMPGCYLHICGSIEGEKRFYSHYKPVIDASDNMSYHGFVDVSSAAFEAVLRQCAFVIFPSASEGNSPSVITCMANGGLIPVVTRNADVDLDGYGICIENLTLEATIKAVVRSTAMTLEEVKSQSSAILGQTKRLHTFDYFKQDFKHQLQQAINHL